MKKLAAIVLLAIFTFNIAGYQLLYNLLASKSDATLELALDAKNYNDQDLISIKQPTNLPYYNNSKTFQRIDGEVEIDGAKYKYVKCRIYNDSLEMLCIPHVAKMKINAAENAYAKVANDFQQDDSKKKSGSSTKSFQKTMSEYETLNLSNAAGSFCIINNTFVSFNTLIENNRFFNMVEQPPDAAMA